MVGPLGALTRDIDLGTLVNNVAFAEGDGVPQVDEEASGDGWTGEVLSVD